ncbi:hypothetical protein ABU178_19820 [Pantoea osteomyelitidis]|uniref:Uncharacterized protein n=1 Tax=Pantoea osteomyelitidis TaxID=3230026 RepID=A0ABW7Q1D5_9GAMM
MYYITDIWKDEPDILTPLRNKRLVIKNLEGQVIYSRDAPEDGWTHELLTEIQPSGAGRR